MTAGAIATGLVALMGSLGYQLDPDVSRLLEPGYSLDPSPAGRALGQAGYGAVVWAHAIAAGLVVALVWRTRPAPLALLAFAPTALWLLPVGVHVLGALLFIGGVALGWRLGLVGAAVTHLATLPLIVARLVEGSWFWRVCSGVVLVFGFVGLAVTDYGDALFSGSLSGRDVSLGLVVGGYVALLSALPWVAGGRRVPVLLVGATGALTWFSTAGDFARESSPGLMTVLYAGSRYALPVAALGLVRR